MSTLFREDSEKLLKWFRRFPHLESIIKVKISLCHAYFMSRLAPALSRSLANGA